jgi:hypothetical protein
MAIQTFELVSPFLSIYAPSRQWKGDRSLLLGQTANALSTGEMLKIDASSYGVDRAQVAFENDGGTDVITTAPGFAYFSETGRGDIVTAGNVPILQFGPYEADTMIFDRASSGQLINGVTGQDLSTADVGKMVGIFGVRHHKDFADANYGTGAYIQSGLGVLSAAQFAAGAFKVGYISRITGTGTKMRVRILFGI